MFHLSRGAGHCFAPLRPLTNYTGPGIVSGTATFFLDGVEVYETTLSEPTAWGSGLDIPLAGDTIMCFTRRIPEGYPCGPEGRLALSFNARIPGHVLQPGLEMVVELDAEGILLLQPGSQPRFPASGSVALDVVEVPPLSLTIVPVLYDTDANRSTNAHVEAVARDLAGPGSEGALLYTREVLPIGELHVNLREPWYTTADTATGPHRFERGRHLSDPSRGRRTSATGSGAHRVLSRDREVAQRGKCTGWLDVHCLSIWAYRRHTVVQHARKS